MDMTALTLIIITMVVIIANVVSDNYQVVYWATGILISFAGLLRLYKQDKKKQEADNDLKHDEHEKALLVINNHLENIDKARTLCNVNHTEKYNSLLLEFKETNKEIINKIDGLTVENNKRFDTLDQRIYELATK